MKPHLSLRDVEIDDFSIILEWWNNPPLKDSVRAEHFWPTLLDLQTTYWPIWKQRDPKKQVLLIALLDDKPIGEVGYRVPDPPGDTAEVDIKIGELHLWGKGYGTAAMKLLIDRLFADPKILRITARPGEWNRRSIGLFKKLGFRETGRETVPPSLVFEGGIALLMVLAREDVGRNPL